MSIATPWTANVVTLFPEAFPGALNCSLIGSSLAQGVWRLQTFDLREFGSGKHRRVDDTPAGGGAGMVLRADVVSCALEAAISNSTKDQRVWPIICTSARGEPFMQRHAVTWSKCQGVTILCGRFEGIDQRVIEHFGMKEISIGNFVLSGGEIAAQALIEATVRLIPSVLGNRESLTCESYTDGLLEYPQYTRPAVWNGRPIPQVLTSGNHAEIAAWRRASSEEATKKFRPELWREYVAGQRTKIAMAEDLPGYDRRPK